MSRFKLTEGKTVTLDFETYYDSKYSLIGALNTSEYIRHPEFKIHCVGIKIGNRPTKTYHGAQIAKALNAIDWSKKALLCQNTAFDGFILHEHFDIHPAMYLDTLCMARACLPHNGRHDLDTLAKLFGLGGKTKRAALANTKGKLILAPDEQEALEDYCADDVNDTFEIYKRLRPYMPDDEMWLAHMTLRMFCKPKLTGDEDALREEIAREVLRKQTAVTRTKAPLGDLMSNKKFAETLKRAGINPPTKISPTTGKQTWAFSKSDKGFKALLHSEIPEVRALAEARMAVKSTIKETRAKRFLEACEGGQPLPVLLNYCGAHTTRWSGGNKMNMQNLPRPQYDPVTKDIVPNTGVLRRAIYAPKGHVIVVADSSQIEARTLAWLAEQMDIVNTFASGEDVYKLMASRIYNVPVDQVTGEQRFIGKVCVLALGYGMGHIKLQHTLELGIMGPPVKMTLNECKQIVDLYRSANDKIREFWNRMTLVLEHMVLGKEGTIGPVEYGAGWVQLPNGLFLQYPELKATPVQVSEDWVSTEFTYATRRGPSKIYGGLLTENLVQALARCIVAEHMLEVDRAGWEVVTMTHDEIVALAPERKAEQCFNEMIQIMTTVPSWAEGLPLAAEGGWDRNYSK